MRNGITLLAVCALAGTVQACKGAQEGEAENAAAGKILPRSISDDMLPYDTVRSQPPLAATARKKDDATRGAAEDSPSAEDDAGDAEAPVETPAEQAESPAPPPEAQ